MMRTAVWLCGLSLWCSPLACAPPQDDTTPDGNSDVVPTEDSDTPGEPIDLAEGRTLVSDGGVMIEVPPGSGHGTFWVTGLLTSEADAVGQRDDDGYIVSPVYDILTEGLTPGMLTAPLKISLVVDLSPMDPPLDEHLFYVEVYDEAEAEWVAVGNGFAAEYDAATGMVSFLTPHCSQFRVRDLGLVKESEWGFLDIFSDARLQKRVCTTEYCDIVYYENAALGQNSRHAVPTDATWDPVGRGSYADPAVPDYVEDIAAAIQQAHQYHTALQASDGATVFSAPGRFTCHVVDFSKRSRGNTGGDYSFTTGSIRITPHLTRWGTDMQTTVGHELAHLFCDHDYYTAAGALQNQWFFEAVANLYAAQAFHLTDEQAAACFGELMSNYLSVPLDAPDEGSMYSAADFLLWLDRTTGLPLATDALQADLASDLAALQSVTPGSSDFVSLFTQYVRQVWVGRNTLRSNVTHTTLEATSATPGWKYASARPYLSSELVLVRGQMAVDGLLVVMPEAERGATLQAHSYVTPSTSQSTVTDVSATLEKQTPAGRPLTVKHFGKQGTPGVTAALFMQVLVNTSLTPELASGPHDSLVAAPAALTFRSYVLQPPVLKMDAAPAGGVAWEFPELLLRIHGQADTYTDEGGLIKGFNVYQNGVKLNADLIDPTARTYAPVAEPCRAVVTVVDGYDNEWPEAAGVSVPCEEAPGTWRLAERKVVRNDWERGHAVSSEYNFTCRAESDTSYFTEIVELGFESSSYMRATHTWAGLGSNTLTPGARVNVTLANSNIAHCLHQSNMTAQTIFESTDLVLTKVAEGATPLAFALTVPDRDSVADDLVFTVRVQDSGTLWEYDHGFATVACNIVEVQYRYTYTP